MRQQKDELRVQFAREIEAAHAQLGENETRLIYEHLITLQQLRDEKKQGIVQGVCLPEYCQG